jgi:ribosomal protein L7/L12
MDIDALIDSLIKKDSKANALETLAVQVSCQILASVHLAMSGVDLQLEWRNSPFNFGNFDTSISGTKPLYGLEESLSRFVGALKEDKQFQQGWNLHGLSLDLELFPRDEVPDLILDGWNHLFELAAYFCEDPEEALLPIELKQKRYVIPFPEQDSRKFTVTLEEVGKEKAKIGREVRSLVKGLGLNEAVELIKSAPVKILEGVSKDEAELAKSSLEAFGARVSITAN